MLGKKIEQSLSLLDTAGDDLGSEYVLRTAVVTGTVKEESPNLSGPYLGQRPPGPHAEVFAPGIVSTDAEEVMYGFFNDGGLLLFERTPTDRQIGDQLLDR